MEMQKLLADQVADLYDHTVYGSAATLINGSILVFVLRDRVAPLNLVLWLGGAVLVSVIRLSLYWGYRRAGTLHLDTVYWKRLFLGSILLAGVLWGAAAIALFPADAIGHQAFVALVIGGMVAGAVSSFTAVSFAFYLFSVPALTPIIVGFFLLGSEIHIAMGSMTLLFLSIMCLFALRNHRNCVRLLSLRYENSELVEELRQEITQRKQAEAELRQRNQEALRRGEERYRELVENINDVLFTMDRSGRITYISPVVETVFGHRPQDVQGKRYREIIHAEDLPQAEQDFEKALVNKAVVNEYRIINPSGQLQWCRSSVRPIEEDNHVVGIQGILADITQSKLLEEQLLRAHKMEALGTLAGGVAHDLNNILCGIVSYPDLLMLDLPPDSALREPLATIKSSGEKATAIVQDLLTLARRGVAATELLNLNHIIEEYLHSPEFKALQSFYPDIRIKRDLQSDLFNLVGSRVHLAKTLMNLVANAAEAMPTGGTITIETANLYTDQLLTGFESVAEGEYVVLTVADVGVGIEEKDLARIFEPFYTKKAMGRSGSGLGMAVVWGTVKDHGGYINAKSRKGAGSCFELLFPATRRELPASVPPVPYEAYLGRGQTILVIDDVKQQRDIAARMLTRLGYLPHTVAGGEAAIDYLREKSADLILLDMIMAPGIDGLETYREILKINPHQKAIIVSGYSETEQVCKTQALGAGRYIKKPYTLETIGMAIKKELER